MKRITAIILALMMFLTGAVTVSADTGEGTVFISHVYGGGGKGETPIANNFIELQNTGSTECDLTGYTLVYGEKTVDLAGNTIPAGGSFLITGAAETTTDELLSLDLPEADMTCNWVIDNKNYTIELKNSDSTVDTVTAAEDTEREVSKQKSLKHNADDTYEVIGWKKADNVVNAEYVAANSPKNSKGEAGKVHEASAEPVDPSEPAAPSFTPVVTGDSRVQGFYNGAASLDLELAGRYNSEAMNADGGSLEIVDYNDANGFAYAVSGVKGKVIAVDMNENISGEKVKNLEGKEFDLKKAIEKALEGFTYGDITSVAVSPDGKHLAAAVQADANGDAGAAALFTCSNDGSIELVSAVRVGVQPDMVTFADDETILTADEGEPREGQSSDPKGSVSIVKVSENEMTATPVYFDKYDSQRDELAAAGVLIQKGIDPSEDFEPEYIVVSGGTAYVSLQEANSIAVLDIASGEFTGVYPLGLQDYSKTKVDLEKNDTVELKNYDNVYGIKMPDGIAVKVIGGKTYVLTANEGDSRADWPGMDNESEGKTSPTGSVTLDSKVVWFNASMWDGLDDSKAYVFGGRSFSMYEVASDGLKLVYDSGSSLEEITAQKLPQYFNCSNDKISLDNRSGKKGPEPETVTTGVIDGKTYAFMAIERIGGIAVYDITSPAEAKFVNYINSREFDAAIQGDVSPEGLKFTSSTKGSDGKPVIMAACEVSGTLAVYNCSAVKEQEPESIAIKSAKLSYTTCTYNGKTRTPSVTVKDAAGKTLEKDRDYSVSYQSGRKYVGKYKVTVKGEGNYSGTKVLYFTIVPKAPASAAATLTAKYSTTSGYDDVKFSWDKSTGASGYTVYYKKSSASGYTYLTRTTKTNVYKKDLYDRVKYTFKVVPYYKDASGTRYDSITYETANVYTLKKLSAPKVTRSGSKVKVKWNNIYGESGYQISRSASKTGTNIVSTYSTTSGACKLINATKSRTYYYKVRAYKTIDGKKVYGPWSSVTKFKR